MVATVHSGSLTRRMEEQLHGDEHAANRFYLEDLAIGTMRPILDVDIER